MPVLGDTVGGAERPVLTGLHGARARSCRPSLGEATILDDDDGARRRCRCQALR